MSNETESESRKLLSRLRDALASPGDGQDRLNRITHLIADSMGTEVCSIYLFREKNVLELYASQGLLKDAIHKTRMKLGEGLVGQIARNGIPINTPDAPSTPGFRYMPETGEEIYSSFLGLPIQRIGQTLGVLVVQSKAPRNYSDDELYALEIVAMVLAEIAELGAFTSEGNGDIRAQHRFPHLFRGVSAQEGAAQGYVWLHEPRVVVTNPIADDPVYETERIRDAVGKLRVSIDDLFSAENLDKEQVQVLEAYRMFANSRGWLRRMEEDIANGLSAEAAVEKEQSAARARLSKVQDAYLRERLSDLDDLSNRLLRILTGQGRDTGAEMPEKPILIARNIGPGELLEYGRKLHGVVLEEGSVGSHAAVVARALSIPLVINAQKITAEALNGDAVLVDGDQGVVHLRPEESVARAFDDKIAMQAEAQARYAGLRDLPATTLCGETIELCMNAGLMADLPSLNSSGAEGVGLFRTELQFLIRSRMPRRAELASLYARIMDAAGGKPVFFRTLDIGSDKVLPYLKPQDEPNPAMGWRAIRVGLDKPGVLRMQTQALLRAAKGRPLYIMFPFITQMSEYDEALRHVMRELHREISLGHPIPESLKVGAMLETPSLAFAPQAFFDKVDFLSIGGNDLKQFFFAADRENELVRRRYDMLSFSFLDLIDQIVQRCAISQTPLSFCGEDAGRPIEAAVLAAIGLRRLSMRPASIGPVKALLRRIRLPDLRAVIEEAKARGEQSSRGAVTQFLSETHKG